MKLVALETVEAQLSLCLWENGRAKSVKKSLDGESHSQRLMPLLHQAFDDARWSPADVDAVAVDIGPGRFTGLRIGVAAARTLGQALQKPLVEVTSLEAMAAASSGWEVGKPFVWKFPHDLLCVVADARRGDIFMAVWRFHRLGDRAAGAGRKKSLHTFGHHFKLIHPPTLFPFDRFLAFFQSCFREQAIVFAGTAVEEYRPSLQKAFPSGVRFAPSAAMDVRWVAALGAEKFYRRETKPYAQVLPLYLRPSYAEENNEKRVLS
jgi:tRNA threonylcarbamoyladenosine biosynthesis protein TsaB